MLCALLFAPAGGALAQDAGRPALPDPLSLEQALVLANDAHPDVALAAAQRDAARAGLTQAQSLTGLRSYLDLTPQVVKPTTSVRLSAEEQEDEYVNDSRARLMLQKRLYDFGRAGALEQAAHLELDAREQLFWDARQRRHIEVMARFFDVILADLRYAVDNEALAFNFTAFDRARERQAYGQVSDVDLLELEHRYRESLVVRTQSQKRQAATRNQLALALNRPDSLPRDLLRPPLPDLDREVPDMQEILRLAREHQATLVAARRELEAARAALSAERARRRPVLSAEAEAAWYERELGSRDALRATLNLRVPIYMGGEDRAAIESALARVEEREARLARLELDLSQTVLDLVQELETLSIQRQAADVRLRYRALYLDRSRALYEMEVRTDLGDAMTRVSEAEWIAAQADFRTALTWAKIDALTGRLLAAPSLEKTP